MTHTTNATQAGKIKIGNYEVNRMGFGAMRLTGRGIWGEPSNRDQAVRVARRAVELGVDFIDTADAYGPGVSEDIIAEALRPYEGIVIATKGGLVRPGPGEWVADCSPKHLREALRMTEVVSVQNHYNIANREHDDVLSICEEEGIAFIPYFPLGSGRLTAQDGPLALYADKYHVTPAQIALAWLLQRSSVMVPIPGTASIEHLEENIGAPSCRINQDDMAALSHLTLK